MIKFKISSDIKDYADRGYGEQRKLLVFVEEPDRPIVNGDIINDFAWRREHASPYANKDLLAALKSIPELGPYYISSVRYSRHAGCSMCPCSPGYVVSLTEPYLGKKRAVWLKEIKN